MNDLIRLLKRNCPPDGFLGVLHLLLLMDDTCILATSREECLRKMDLLHKFCLEKDIVVNEMKTQFMVINGHSLDKEPLVIRNDNCELHILHTDVYVYLGAHFTSDGRIESCLSAHIEKKSKQVIKLINFLSRNRDAPFLVKKKVFDAAFKSSILYSCESFSIDSFKISCICIDES